MTLATSECRVVFANAKAEDHLRRGAGLRHQRGRLATAKPALTHRLHALAREAARAGCAEGAIGGAVELPRAGSAPLIAHLIPLAANRTEAIFAVDRPAAALFVVDPASDFSAAAKQFADRFGLTSAEGRVLAELLAGKGLHTTAARLGTSDATARTHAQRIFAKTGTHRQAELIRLFFVQSLPGAPHRM
jgi:DNA-binding CsgD family transcriptional regulator